MQELERRLKNANVPDYSTDVVSISNIKITGIRVIEKDITIIEINGRHYISPFRSLWYKGIINYKIGDSVNIKYQIRRESAYAHPWIISIELVK